jgi:outer membrane protein
MKTTALFCIFVVLVAVPVAAQEKWNLPKCVQYAVDNNINIRLADLQTGYAALTLKQDKLAQLPTASLSNSYGMSFGLRENPTTGVLANQRFFSSGINLQTSVAIFNWYSRRNQIAADEFELLAARASVDKQKNDVALLVANLFLQVLLSKEQEKIVDVQLKQSLSQLDRTRRLVNAGSLPELNAAEMEAQVARDSANLITAVGNTQQSILTLKATMNLDAAAPFDIETPVADNIFVENIASLQPDVVYALALQNLPQQRVNNEKYKAAQKASKVAWASRLPTVTGFGGLSTNYIYFRTPLYEQVVTGQTNTGLFVNNGGTVLPVQSPVLSATDKISRYIIPSAYFRQLNTNFGQNIGIAINIPILNGGVLRTNYERSKLNLKNWEIIKEQDNQKLKNDVYQAYNAALTALQKFNSSVKSVATAEKSYDYSQKRYNVGMLGTFELITNQNNLFREKLQYLINQYDYVFKMKVLEFYKGQGLKF